MVGIIRRGMNLMVAYHKWTKAGKPLRNDEYIFALYDDHCSVCPEKLFILHSPGVGECDDCGCKIKRVSAEEDELNKLAWPTEGCPYGHWKADILPEDRDGTKEPIN